MKTPLEKSESSTQGKAANSMDSESENGATIKCEPEVKPSLSMERSQHVLGNVTSKCIYIVNGSQFMPSSQMHPSPFDREVDGMHILCKKCNFHSIERKKAANNMDSEKRPSINGGIFCPKLEQNIKIGIRVLSFFFLEMRLIV